jgi:hypothetical protein
MQTEVAGVTWSPPPAPGEAGIDGSRLRSAPPSTPQRQAAVKLHRVFFPRWESVDCSPTLRGFTGLQAGTAGPSLIHSCTSELSGGPEDRHPDAGVAIKFRNLINLDNHVLCHLTLSLLLFDGHRGPYPTRHLATLRESELLPAFTGPYTGWTRLSGTRTGQDSIAVQNLSVWRLPMFLLNSQDPLVTAT